MFGTLGDSEQIGRKWLTWPSVMEEFYRWSKVFIEIRDEFGSKRLISALLRQIMSKSREKSDSQCIYGRLEGKKREKAGYSA